MKTVLKKVLPKGSHHLADTLPWSKEEARIYASFYRTTLHAEIMKFEFTEPRRLLLSTNPDDIRYEEINLLTQRAAAIATLAFVKWRAKSAQRMGTDTVKEFNQKVGR